MRPSVRYRWHSLAVVCVLLTVPVLAQSGAEELEDRIGEVNELAHQLREVEEVDEAARWARYLTRSVDRLRQMRELRGELNSLSPDARQATRDSLQQEATALQKQIDSDEEFVEVTTRLIKALKDDREEDVEDLVPEISEFLIELESQRKATSQTPRLKPDDDVDSSHSVTGEYFISQSWSQERDFKRPYYVNVPEHIEHAKISVIIFLHGNGGDAKQAMRGFTRNRGKIASRYIMVFPQGYRESWNIVSERSKADDLRFVEAIVRKLAACDNVDANNFTIMGNSNGAALVNQLVIESKLPNIRNYISGVSPLNVWQHDGSNFKAKGIDNNYEAVAEPAKGKRLFNISGTEDRLVPYRGGPSRVIPAKDGKLAFVDAERSTYLWAKQMGYEGEQLKEPTKVDGPLHFFSYLDGDVVHIKVTNEGHGAPHGVSEDVLLEFLRVQKVTER